MGKPTCLLSASDSQRYRELSIFVRSLYLSDEVSAYEWENSQPSNLNDNTQPKPNSHISSRRWIVEQLAVLPISWFWNIERNARVIVCVCLVSFSGFVIKRRKNKYRNNYHSIFHVSEYLARTSNGLCFFRFSFDFFVCVVFIGPDFPWFSCEKANFCANPFKSFLQRSSFFSIQIKGKSRRMCAIPRKETVCVLLSCERIQNVFKSTIIGWIYAGDEKKCHEFMKKKNNSLWKIEI